jgi:hypothetical protein
VRRSALYDPSPSQARAARWQVPRRHFAGVKRMDKAWIDLIELGLKVIAIFGAGIWAFAVLRLLRKDDNATVLARDTEARIRELELRAKLQAALAVDIRPTIARSLDGDGYLITAVVELANRGNQNTKINWKDEPPAFHVRLAKFDGMANRNTIRPFGSGFLSLLTLNPARFPMSFARERRNRFHLPSRSPRRGSICCRFAVSSMARNAPKRKGSACHCRRPGPETNMFW